MSLDGRQSRLNMTAYLNK